MIKIDGKEIAGKIFNSLKEKEKVGANEMLAFVLVGNDAASRSFVERKMSVTREEVNCILILNSDRTQVEKKEAVRVFLVGQGLTDKEIAMVMDDLLSYKNY